MEIVFLTRRKQIFEKHKEKMMEKQRDLDIRKEVPQRKLN